jgi:hypothetical protein
MVLQPDKNGISNMRSIHARVTQNTGIFSERPDIHYENETIQIMCIVYLFIEFLVELAIFIVEKQSYIIVQQFKPIPNCHFILFRT